MVEFAHVAEAVVRGQTPFRRPAQGLVQVTPRREHARPNRRDGPHVRGVVAQLQSLRLVEQGERRGQIAL